MKGIHFGKSALAGIAFGVGALFGSTSLTTPDPSVFVMPHFGIEDAATLVGPAENETGYITPRGMSVEPTGTGVRRFVDPSVPISGNGLTLAAAYKTYAEAVNAAVDGDLILLVPGIYGEEVNADPYPVGPNKGSAAHPIKVAKLSLGGQGGVVEITGTDELNGWSVCTSPADVYGNADFAHIHRIDVSLGADPEVALKDAILQEPDANGELQMAAVTMIAAGMHNAADMEIARFKKLWFNGADAGSEIADLTKTATTGTITLRSAFWSDANYAQGVLDGSEIWANLANNTNFKTEIDSHVAATGDITFTNTKTEAWEGKEMAIRNVPFAISGPGQWAFRDLGGGNWRIWYWPNNPANIERVRVSKRMRGIDLGSASHWEFFGIKVSGVGGPEPVDGRAGGIFSKQQNQFERSGVRFEQCHITACNGGGLTLVDFDDVEIFDCTIDRIPMGRGFVLNKSSRFVAVGNRIRLTGITGFSVASAEEALVAGNEFGEVRSVHGNAASGYLIAEKLWFHGNLFDAKNAIALAMQDGGDFFLTCNVVKLGPDIAQNGFNDNSNTPAGWTRGPAGFTTILGHFPTEARMRYYCNTFLPWAGADPATPANALQIGNTTWAFHDAIGNIVFGIINIRNGTITDTSVTPNVTYVATTLPPRGNVFMGTGANGSPLLDGDNVLVADPAAVLIDPFGYNPMPVIGGQADGSVGDLSGLLPLTEPWFTALPGALALVQRDFAGNALDWTRAPIGAVKGPSIDNPIHPSGLTLSTDPASIDEKALVGTEIGQLSAGAGTSPIIWSLLDNAGGKFALDANKVITAGTLDYATAQEHDVEVQASNLAIGGGVASQVFSITVIENTTLGMDEIYLPPELLVWWDIPAGVSAVDNGGILEVNNWVDRIAGLELNQSANPPQLINGKGIRFPDGVEAGLSGNPPIDLTSLPASCNLWMRVRADSPHNAILITDGNNSSPYVLIAQDGADSDTGVSTIGGTLYSNGAVTPTRGAFYDELATLTERTLLLEGCALNTLDNFSLRGGFASFPWAAPVTVLSVAITTNALSGSAAEIQAKIDATYAFMATKTIS
ncbi:hypothetical protein IWQ54_001149 [Labrenzia sp. EL_195]|nr:hypothetical protein [Labrenzia sp. EL_195]